MLHILNETIRNAVCVPPKERSSTERLESSVLKSRDCARACPAPSCWDRSVTLSHCSRLFAVTVPVGVLYFAPVKEKRES
jgi:hypothetical protein